MTFLEHHKKHNEFKEKLKEIQNNEILLAYQAHYDEPTISIFRSFLEHNIAAPTRTIEQYGIHFLVDLDIPESIYQELIEAVNKINL